MASGLFGSDPLSHYTRSQDKQSRLDQFSEDVRNVIHGDGTHANFGSLGSSCRRRRSPGLAAGAALAIGASAAAEATAESHALRARSMQYARRTDCPFDDHSSFGVGGSKPPKLTSPSTPCDEEMRAAFRVSHTFGKHNRELQQRVGAPAPYDAPERGVDSWSRSSTPGHSPLRSHAFGDARQQAEHNKGRMRGTEGIIAGNYGEGCSSKQLGSLPPRPEQALMPQARVRLAMAGASSRDLSERNVEYLNSKVLADGNRHRNRGTMHLA